ncbi:LOW QUALITY PROTEIN: apoptosis-stimulating of p53 protein 1-like [Amphiura filiformis]|uniref:LOW QUALITY PROTEIN: apoptosis-stimulating of p53 protein 1-like n=1 Tax=Amphiura filiformis TaxID=82378 RepID=UPI003B2148F0
MNRLTGNQVHMIVQVNLSQDSASVIDVPITPETTCQDIIDMCKETGETNCHLAELWRECERPVGEDEHIYEILQQWGVHRNEVKFFLRHESANISDSGKDQGHKPKKKNGLKGGGDDYNKFPSDVDLSLTDLQEMATRQQQQIETQQQMLVAKQQRLKFLKQQEAKHQQITQENDRLRRLRDKVELQEQKLRKLRALRGKVDTTKTTNNNLSTELDTVRTLFTEKEKELVAAVAKVEELTHQLEDLKKGHLSNGVNGGYMHQSPAALQLDRLRQELLRRNKLNEQQSITLQNQQQTLSTRKEEMAAIDKRIEQLTDQLRQKRSLQNLHQAPPLIPNNNNNNMTVPNGSIQRPSSTTVTGTNGVATDSVRPMHDGPVKSLPNGDLKHKKPGPPAAPKPQLMLKPQGFKPNKGRVSAPQGGPVAAQHPGHDGDAKQLESDTPLLSKPGVGKRKQWSDTSSLTENSSVESVPVSGLPPQPLPTVHIKPQAKNAMDNKPNRSSPVQIQRGSPTTTQRSSPIPIGSPVPQNQQRSSPVQRGSPISHQRGSPQQRGSPVPQQRGSPVPQQRGSPVPQQRSSPVPGNRGSPVQRSSPVPQNQPANKLPPRVLSLDSGTSSLQNRQARNRTPIYNPDDLAMLSPPPPSSPNGSSNSGSHVDFDDSIKSGHAYNGNLAPKGRLPSYSGPNGNGTWNGNSSNPNRGPVGPNQHPSSPQRKRQPPPAPPRTVTLNYNPSHPPSPTRTGVTQLDGSHPSSPQLSQGRNNSPMTIQRGPPGSPSRGPPSSPSRVPPGSPSRGGPPVSGAYPGYGPSSNYSTAPSNNGPPRPQLPNDYPVTDPTRPIHQRSPATVGMYAPPPNAQQRNYNHPSYEQNNGGYKYAGKPVNIPSHNLFHIQEGTAVPGYPTDDRDGPRPSSPTSKLPIMNLYRNIDLERFHNMPRPLKKRLSYSEDKESLNFLKREQRDGIPFFHHTESSSDKKFDNLTTDLTVKPRDNGTQSNNGNGSQLMETSLIGNSPGNKDVLSPDVSTNTKPNPVITSQTNGKTNGINTTKKNISGHGQLSKPSGSGKPLSPSAIGEVKGILKRAPNGRESIRVRFDPLALLLDASLEGEFELVQRIIPQVPNPSGANDEGITALHNAICASHYDIVNFLILQGVDVNSPDSDGWTPLHCAASCNNHIMVRNLVEHGAALFATTISDKETPAEKCEEEEEGYLQCSEYLYGSQEKMGTANNSVVYALYSYEATQPDELSFKDGDEITVLRKGDEEETMWWWARRHDKEGYVPRNLFGLFGRIKPLFR